MHYPEGPGVTELHCVNVGPVFADTLFLKEAQNVDFYLKTLYCKELSVN